MELWKPIKDNDGRHKYKVLTKSKDGKKTKTVHFGAIGYGDFTLYSKEFDRNFAEKMKMSYIARHRVNEDWSDPTTASYWSRWVLWNLPTIEASMRWVMTDLKKKGYI